MKIKTTEQIMEETDYIYDSLYKFKEEDEILLNKKWVAVDDVLNWINDLRKSNDMWRYDVDECFVMLENKLGKWSYQKITTRQKKDNGG